jgi:hypothetical protein
LDVAEREHSGVADLIGRQLVLQVLHEHQQARPERGPATCAEENLLDCVLHTLSLRQIPDLRSPAGVGD